jgi:probable addiction module antidote protein
MVEKLTAFDSEKNLTNSESIMVFKAEAFDTGDADHIAHAINIAIRAKGLADVAATAGISIEHLHRALSEADELSLETVMILMKAIGIQITVKT